MDKHSPAATAVISVNYKNAPVTLRCLEALLQLDGAPGTIVIVNNGSEENAPFLQKNWSELAKRYHRTPPIVCHENDPFPVKGDVLLLLKTNGGFSAGNNAALRRLYFTRNECGLFWLLNNDAFPQSDALTALCERAKPHGEHQAGIIGSTLVYAADPSRTQCAGGGTVSPHTGVTRFAAGGKALAAVMRMNSLDVEKNLDYINGASLLIRREVLDAIGFLPDEYFLYFEDVDMCTAAKRAGFKLGWAKQSVVLHMEGASHGDGGGIRGKTPAKPRIIEYYSTRNRLWFIKKFYPKNLPIALAGVLYSLGLKLCRRHWGNLGIIIQAARDAMRGKMRDFHAE